MSRASVPTEDNATASHLQRSSRLEKSRTVDTATGTPRGGSQTKNSAFAMLLLVSSGLCALYEAMPRCALAETTTGVKAYHIPAQALSTALTTFGQQAHMQVSADPKILSGHQSAALNGNFTEQEALARLLVGSGLTGRVSGNVVSVSTTSNITLGPVRVGGTSVKESATGPGVGYVAKYTASSTKTDTPLTEIPNSIYVITKDQMVDQQSQTVQEVLRYMPGIYSESLGTASWGSGSTKNVAGGNFTQRGFASTQYVDGLLSNSEASGETSFLDRVEALNGPSSVMYGQSGPGGLISMQLKKPTDTPLHNATLGFGNWGRYEATIDLSDKITKSGNLKYRIAAIGVIQGNQTEHINYHRVGVLPSIKWEIDQNTNLTLLGMYMYTLGDGSGNYYPLYGTLMRGTNGYIPRSRFLGDPAYNISGNKEAKFEYQFTHKFNRYLEFQQNFSYENSRQFFNNTYGSSLASDGQTYTIYGWKGNLGGNTSEIQKTLAVDSRLVGHINSGPVSQTWLVSIIAI